MSERVFKLVTGNRLHDGAVVYFTGVATWTCRIDDARLVDEMDGAALLAEAQAGPPPHPTVGPALIDAVLEGNRIVPMTLREKIRALGPTITYLGT